MLSRDYIVIQQLEQIEHLVKNRHFWLLDINHKIKFNLQKKTKLESVRMDQLAIEAPEPEQLGPRLEEFINGLQDNEGQLDWFINFQTLYKTNHHTDSRRPDHSKKGFGDYLFANHSLGRPQTERYKQLMITYDKRNLISIDGADDMRIWDLEERKMIGKKISNVEFAVVSPVSNEIYYRKIRNDMGNYSRQDISKFKRSKVTFKKADNQDYVDFVFSKDEKKALIASKHGIHIFNVVKWKICEPEYLNLRIGDKVFELQKTPGTTFLLKNREDIEKIPKSITEWQDDYNFNTESQNDQNGNVNHDQEEERNSYKQFIDNKINSITTGETDSKLIWAKTIDTVRIIRRVFIEPKNRFFYIVYENLEVDCYSLHHWGIIKTFSKKQYPLIWLTCLDH